MEQNNSDQDISAIQGSSLASLILEGQYSWNEQFDGEAVNIDNKNIIYNNDYNIYLLSPNTEKLNLLSYKWLSELRERKFNFSLSDEPIFDDAYEFYMLRQKEKMIREQDIASFTDNIDKSIEDIVLESTKEERDNSPINGSSISFIIEYNGKKLLFLADAHPDIIIDSILKLKNERFDLVKVSHHGSVKNTTKELAQILNSDLFLISTNGCNHSHPDFESLAKIIYYQNPKRLFFNYFTSNAKKIDNAEWKKKYNYNIHISDGSNITTIKL